MFLVPRKERRYQYVKCFIWGPLNCFPPQYFRIYLKIIAYRDKFTIPASSELELFSQYVMISWQYIVTKTFIIDDVGVWDLPLGKAFPKMLKSSKIKIYIFKKKNRTRCETYILQIRILQEETNYRYSATLKWGIKGAMGYKNRFFSVTLDFFCGMAGF